MKNSGLFLLFFVLLRPEVQCQVQFELSVDDNLVVDSSCASYNYAVILESDTAFQILWWDRDAQGPPEKVLNSTKEKSIMVCSQRPFRIHIPKKSENVPHAIPQDGNLIVDGKRCYFYKYVYAVKDK